MTVLVRIDPNYTLENRGLLLLVMAEMNLYQSKTKLSAENRNQENNTTIQKI